jgi:putative tryptophan/tyrosine transport system substrate-binding protein
MKTSLMLLLIVVVTLAQGISAKAQQPKRIPRIGFMVGTSPSIIPDRIEGFRQGLRELGYVEGKTLSSSIGWPRAK